MEVALGLHVVVEGVASLITLTAVFAVASVQGLPYPVLLSIVVALLRLVPFLGPPMCLAVGLTAGHSIDTTAAAVTGIAVLGIERLANALANNMLSHRRHNAFLVILVAVATVKLGGWVGLLAAPALASVIEVAAAHLRGSSAPGEVEGPKFTVRIEALEAAVVQRGGPRGRRLLPVLHKLQQMLKSQNVS